MKKPSVHYTSKPVLMTWRNRLSTIPPNQFLWHEETVCPLYLQRFHSQYASMAICSRNGCRCQNSAWKLALLMCVINHCMIALWPVQKGRTIQETCGDAVWRQLSFILSIEKTRGMFLFRISFYLNVIIRSGISLNESAFKFNIVNNALNWIPCGLVGSLLFSGFSVFDGWCLSTCVVSVSVRQVAYIW